MKPAKNAVHPVKQVVRTASISKLSIEMLILDNEVKRIIIVDDYRNKIIHISNFVSSQIGGPKPPIPRRIMGSHLNKITEYIKKNFKVT